MNTLGKSDENPEAIYLSLRVLVHAMALEEHSLRTHLSSGQQQQARIASANNFMSLFVGAGMVMPDQFRERMRAALPNAHEPIAALAKADASSDESVDWADNGFKALNAMLRLKTAINATLEDIAEENNISEAFKSRCTTAIEETVERANEKDMLVRTPIHALMEDIGQRGEIQQPELHQGIHNTAIRVILEKTMMKTLIDAERPSPFIRTLEDAANYVAKQQDRKREERG